MKDYCLAIKQALENLGGSFNFETDPNTTIDERLSNVEISWYPTYLVISNNTFYMFRPFSSEAFLDDSEIKEEWQNALFLVNRLKEKGIDSTIFFITDTIQDVETLEKQNLPSFFGILHTELEKPQLDFKITSVFKVKCKLVIATIEYLAGSKNLKGKIGDKIREFSKNYLERKPEETDEISMIKKFIREILTCDDRFKLNTDPIDFMANIEKTLFDANYQLRGHYYHTINTMMIGFMFIDKAYGTFENLIRNYGDDIVLEFIWVLTSVYHDIGHPVFKQQYLACESYGLDPGENLSVIDGIMQEERSAFWQLPEYCFAVKVLDNLFNHVFNDTNGKWIFDGFAHQSELTTFKNSLKVSFIEKGAHGVVGAIKLALLTNKHIKDVKVNNDREFLYRHILIAGLSILFHDSKVRDTLRQNELKQVEARRFPLSALLTYVDIMQDDRRDLTGSSSRPDIFEDVHYSSGQIKAVLNDKVLSVTDKKRLLEELKEALSFFIMNGVSFVIPEQVQ